MKYLKTYESMEFSKKINDIKYNREENISKIEKEYTLNYNKTIDEYKSKVAECFLYLSDNFEVNIGIDNYPSTNLLGLSERKYYFNIYTKFYSDEFEEFMSSLERSLDRLEFELKSDILSLRYYLDGDPSKKFTNLMDMKKSLSNDDNIDYDVIEIQIDIE